MKRLIRKSLLLNTKKSYIETYWQNIDMMNSNNEPKRKQMYKDRAEQIKNDCIQKFNIDPSTLNGEEILRGINDFEAYLDQYEQEADEYNQSKKASKDWVPPKYVYQTDVVETIFDKHGYLIWTAYNPDLTDKEGFNEMDLIIDAPNGERKVLSDTPEHREYMIGLVDKMWGWDK